MSKKIQFLFLCYKCIFWCWWARGVYGNVSRALQTRKTTKNCTTFLIIHYNRDLNTNGHLMLLLADLSFGVSQKLAREMTYSKKYLLPEAVLEIWLGHLRSPRVCGTPLAEVHSPGLRLPRERVNFEYFLLPCMTCPPEADHIEMLSTGVHGQYTAVYSPEKTN